MLVLPMCICLVFFPKILVPLNTFRTPVKHSVVQLKIVKGSDMTIIYTYLVDGEFKMPLFYFTHLRHP